MAATNPGVNVEHDEWNAFPRSYLPKGGMDSIDPTTEDPPDAVTPPQGT
jgi:hypothetical protein